MVSIITAVIANTNKIINENSVSERKREKEKEMASIRKVNDSKQSIQFYQIVPHFMLRSHVRAQNREAAW